MGFLTGFATGALRAANTRYDEKRALEYEKDKRNSEMVTQLALTQAASWPELVATERENMSRYKQFESLYGPEVASFAMATGETNLDNLARIKATGGTPGGGTNYAQLAQQRMADMRKNIMGTLRTAMGDQYNEALTGSMLPEPDFGQVTGGGPTLSLAPDMSVSGGSVVSMQNALARQIITSVPFPKDSINIKTDPVTQQMQIQFADDNVGAIYGKLLGMAESLQKSAPDPMYFLQTTANVSDIYRVNYEHALTQADNPTRDPNKALAYMANLTPEEMFNNWQTTTQSRPGAAAPQAPVTAPAAPTETPTSFTPDELLLQQGLVAEQINNLNAGVDGNVVYQTVVDGAMAVILRDMMADTPGMTEPTPEMVNQAMMQITSALQNRSPEEILDYYNEVIKVRSGQP